VSVKLITVQDLNEGDLVTIETLAEIFKIELETVKSWVKQSKKRPQDYPVFPVIGKTTFCSKSEFVRLLNRKCGMLRAG